MINKLACSPFPISNHQNFKPPKNRQSARREEKKTHKGNQIQCYPRYYILLLRTFSQVPLSYHIQCTNLVANLCSIHICTKGPTLRLCYTLKFYSHFAPKKGWILRGACGPLLTVAVFKFDGSPRMMGLNYLCFGGNT